MAKTMRLNRAQGSIAEATAAQKREGFEAVGFTADVGVEREAEAIVQQAMNVFGLIDILVNNAGNAIGGLLWKNSSVKTAPAADPVCGSCRSPCGGTRRPCGQPTA